LLFLKFETKFEVNANLETGSHSPIPSLILVELTMARTLPIVVAGAMLFVSACGSSTGDRAASGAGIGAGVGAAVGAVTGLSILEGAVIGAAAGGLLGGLTSEDTINLGDPIWAKDDKPANASAVSRVQAGLSRLGYDPGPVDGVMGRKTEMAIRSYQRDHHLTVDGRPTVELAQHLDSQLKLAGS
jgi:putative peptidoglycan binding protein/YmgG-like glycine-zipper protein